MPPLTGKCTFNLDISSNAFIKIGLFYLIRHRQDKPPPNGSPQPLQKGGAPQAILARDDACFLEQTDTQYLNLPMLEPCLVLQVVLPEQDP